MVQPIVSLTWPFLRTSSFYLILNILVKHCFEKKKKRSEQRLRLKYLDIVFCALDSHELTLNSIYYN